MAARVGLVLAVSQAPLHAQRPATDSAVPQLAALVGKPASELRDVVSRYADDRSAMERRWDVEYSSRRRARLREFTRAWQAQLASLDFDRLGQQGRIDYVLLDHRLRYELALLDREEKLANEMRPIVPFLDTIAGLQEARRRFEIPDPSKTAATVDRLARSVGDARKKLESGADKPSKIIALRAASTLNGLRSTLGDWYHFYSGYDPLFTWWTADPFKRADDALKGYVTYLREKIVGVKEGEDEPIVGDPIGAEGLAADLDAEMIPYTPAQLVQLAEKEFAWCEAEMKKASRAMGFGDDWKQALEKVKQSYVEPGKQTALVRDLIYEAIGYITRRNLVTVPPLAEENIRMVMLSPERQKTSPFFLGGDLMMVSYPTDGMSHEDKMMSLRGNNPYFSRAVAHHEMIPGHHLQGFMNERYNSHRQLFGTPFWTEGWALYWEFLLYDLGFAQTPEQKVGMLFWRMHRAARIIFSLSFHLGTMNPQQAIDFLVDRVGHERANATAEVRRSFNGSYPPLYQAGYMLGGLQFWSLHESLVKGGKMTDRQFHDAILQGGSMPVEMVRAMLVGTPLTREYHSQWKFYPGL
jgi:uncharacterized protein (DUF885 family)